MTPAGSIQQTLPQTQSNDAANADSILLDVARNHPCAKHDFFEVVRSIKLTPRRAGALLRNYDAHASVLRRLLIKAASIMPEMAVGYVLENVRTEFGAGNVDDRHQLQLIDVALQTGITLEEFESYSIQPGIKRFIKAVTPFYYPMQKSHKAIFGKSNRGAISAGAITATEILAIEEFKALQIAFEQFNLQSHIWFDHVTVEVDHTEESLALATYFMQANPNYNSSENHTNAVMLGLNGVLDANVALYDGLLEALRNH
ncbi:MAG: hypothetical protein P4L53_28900 [Candidatus Obscuribacterales bacterium]|nr:hypothetical protein [Candidatus Obscuribacterales bacterium]